MPTDISANQSAAQTLTSLYNDVTVAMGNTIRAAMKFGAALIEWEEILGGSCGAGHAGDGIKGWLANNCPSINYQTAMGYKHLAEKGARMLGAMMPQHIAVATLADRDSITTPDGRTITIDAEYKEVCNNTFAEATSRRKLEQMYFNFYQEERRPGRRPGESRSAPVAKTPMDEAKELFAFLCRWACDCKMIPSMALWDAAMLEATVNALTPVLAEAKKRLAESR